MPCDVEVCALQFPGRQQRAAEPPLTRMPVAVQALRNAVRPYLDRPFAVFGICTGSLIGYSLAQRLRAEHGKQMLALIAACCRAPHMPDRDAPIHALAEDALWNEIRRLGGTSSEISENGDLRALLTPVLRADFEMAETYRHRDAPPLDCPIVVFGGSQDPVVSLEEIEAWRMHTTASFDVQMLDGGHYLLDGSSAALAAAIADRLGIADHASVREESSGFFLGKIEARLAQGVGAVAMTAPTQKNAVGDNWLAAFDAAPLDAASPTATDPALAETGLEPPFRLETMSSAGADSARDVAPPEGETERIVAGIWADVLGVGRVGRHDNFFDLGGHSLLAARVAARVRQAFGVETPVGRLFDRPTLAEFAEGLLLSAANAVPPVVAAARDAPLVLSFAQQRLWLLAQIERVSQAYHIPSGFRLRGDLDVGALRQALDRIVARHEALRTRFITIDEEPAQLIADAGVGFTLREHDLSGAPDPEDAAQRLAADDAQAPFDLESGPIVRGLLLRLADREHVLMVTMHHVVSDGWSIAVFTRELGALYAAFRDGRDDPLPPLAVQYPDYARWQRGWLFGALLDEQDDYWRRALADAPALLGLPTDRPRPAEQVHAGAAVAVELDEGLTAALKALSRRHGTSLFMTLLAGWAAVLSRLSGQDDVVIGAPTANRRSVELEPLIGFFVNTLALRLDLSGEPSGKELLERVKARVLEAQLHQDAPFERVVEIVRPPRSLAHAPVFQAMLAWQNNEEATLDLPGLSVAPFETPGRFAKFDLTLNLSESGDRIVGEIEFATALFDRETVERWAGYLCRLLEGMAADEACPVERLPILGEVERHRLLVEWNATDVDYPREQCVHELFEAQAARTPDAVAVVYEGSRLTYHELNAQANRLARHLRSLGVKPHERVAICVERGLEMVIGLLAVLKAGGAYVPLDPAYPVERLATMLEDSAPVVVLTHGLARRTLREALAGQPHELSAIDIDAEAGAWASADASNLEPASICLTAGSLAYVIYTSGSTGRPKGVQVEHRGLVNCLWSMREIVGISASDRALALTTIGFDIAGIEIYLPLISGARTVIADRAVATDPDRLGALIKAEGLTVMQATPTTWRMLIDAGWQGQAGLRGIAGGEALPSALADEIVTRVRSLINVYGPTETTIWSSSSPIAGLAEKEAASESIGRPISNTRFYLLDRHAEPVPTGVAGEIYIGGAGIARGYLNRADLTAERFLASPYVEGDRLYRTGDLGRYRFDGAILFLGRNDFQVKVRGFRIELGEIEARLARHPAIDDAVVVAREDSPGDKRLVAYYTAPAGAPPPGAEALRLHLSHGLPDYMLPGAYVRLDAFPLTANGKLDWKALPAPETDAYPVRGYEAPRGETEQILAQIWGDVLKVGRIGRNDNFFDLGGHSMLGLRLLARIEKQTRQKLALRTLYQAPTIAVLARSLAQNDDAWRSFSAVALDTRRAGAPIFMVHIIEQDLARHLGRQRPVYGLSYGLAAADGSRPFASPQTIEDLAAHYIEEMCQVQPQGPYRLIGHSLVARVTGTEGIALRA